MIRRALTPELRSRLSQMPAVALLGPRQVGKTTLALSVAAGRTVVYLDLESPADLRKLSDPEDYLSRYSDALVILDEVQRVPEIFAPLRGLIDRARRSGEGAGRYLLLGSAAPDLLRQSSETLAGRIAYLELGGIDAREVPGASLDPLWLRGGFPDSYLSSTDALSLAWRHALIRTYLERDIPALGVRLPAETLRRFWTMVAHAQGGLFNASVLARSLGIDNKTIGRYLDLLVDLLLVRRLAPWHANVKKRLVKAPKIYIRDSGLVHSLLGIADEDTLLGHPIAGASWEGFVIESLIAATNGRAECGFYRTGAGAEVDLLLQFGTEELWAVEIKRGLAPRLSRGFHSARADLQPTKCWVVYGGTEEYALDEGVRAIGPKALAEKLHERTRVDP